MRRFLLFFVLFFCIEGICLHAQVGKREYSSNRLSDRDGFHDRFNNSILHITDLQNLFGKSVEEMSAMLEQRHHEYVTDETDNYIWALNAEQLYDFPVLFLIYHPKSQTMQYICSDSSLINYLVEEFPKAGYRQTSEQQYVSSKFEVVVGKKLYNVGERQEDMWVIEIVDREVIEQRRAEHAAKLLDYQHSADSLKQVALRIIDTSRLKKKDLESLIESLLQSEQTGDEYNRKRSYDKARGAYTDAIERYNKTVYPEINEVSSYLSRERKHLVDDLAFLEKKYAPLTFKDLNDQDDDIIAAISEIDGYIESYALYDDWGAKLKRKLKVNDCDEIQRDYKYIYRDRKTIEKLYDQKGFELLKRESESKMRNFESERDDCYRKNKDLISFLNLSKSQFERAYNEVGEEKMIQRLGISYDSLLLCAISQSPSLEKANLKKSRVLKIDNKYKALFKQNTINLDDYKNSQVYSQIVNIVVGRNVATNKEYRENGHYFSSKQAFFDSYISPYYEKQLHSYKKAEKEKKEREELARKKQMEQQKEQERRQQELVRQQQRKKQDGISVDPPLKVFAMGLTGGIGGTYSEFQLDYHCGLYLMFPTRKKVSWGLFCNLGLRSSFYMDAGLQFFHGTYRNWQFLWGVGAGYGSADGVISTLRLGTRYRALVLFTDINVLPTATSIISVKAGIGINIGR